MVPDHRAPTDALDAVRDAEARMLAAIAPLDDAVVARPSRLPGWTVGHLLTHLARNADSQRRRTEGAVDGVVVDQYPGGADERAAEIEAGAGRTAGATVADVQESTEKMLAAWQGVPESAWANVTRDLSGRERTLDELPARRWQEVELHLVDLGIGPTHRDWSDAFVEDRLPELRRGAAARLPDGGRLPPPGHLDARDELAWLYGRLQRSDLPVLGPWQ